MGSAQADAPLQTVLDSITDGVFTVDTEWRVTFFNCAAEHITGVPRQSALGRRCCDVFHASICESACALRQTLVTGRPVVNKVVYIVNSRGQRVPISISTAVLRDSDGRFTGGVETFRDLTQVEELRKALASSYSLGDLVGRSPGMRSVFELLPVVAEHDTTVLIQGESGTGKELVARAIHALSPRHRRAFIAINCSALPESLLESELFGYRAGAFTDARRDKPGRFDMADGGTLFLDEIGDVPLAMQAKLLRVLQDGVFEPLGGVRPVKSNVRILTATNHDLDALVRDGRFRADLFYRVNVFRVSLPPLRDRREDIPLLIDHLLARLGRLRGKDIAGVSEEALALLLEHDYPGNVRELENVLEHAMVVCEGGLIEPRHLPAELRAGVAAPARTPALAVDKRTQQRALTLREIELVLIDDALRRNGGNRSAAARSLGINPSTLYRKMKAARTVRQPRRQPRG